MKPEYFPPKEDVILQNEAPTEFYVLVTGAVVRKLYYLILALLLVLALSIGLYYFRPFPFTFPSPLRCNLLDRILSFSGME